MAPLPDERAEPDRGARPVGPRCARCSLVRLVLCSLASRPPACPLYWGECMSSRVPYHWAVLGLLALACGGRTEGVAPSGSSGGGSSGGTSSGGSSGSSGGETSSSSSSGVGPSCVYIDLGTYDQSCNAASDCIFVTSGEICDGDCTSCGDSLVSASEAGRYADAIATIVPGTCICGAPGIKECINHKCASGFPAVDGGPVAVDATAVSCVFIDPSTYDQSCKQDSDCIEITPGSICSGNCACGGAAVNADGQSRYDEAINSLVLAACACPLAGIPRCVQGMCTQCDVGPAQPVGCWDGG
jgi:hypothetical protein